MKNNNYKFAEINGGFMKQIFLALFIIMFSTSIFSQQKKLFFETGASIGFDAVSINFTTEYFNPQKLFAGVGLTVTGIMNYNGIKKPKSDADINQLSYELPIKGVEERGPYGVGAGVRLLSNTGLAIEGGYILTWHSKYTLYDVGGSTIKYIWEQNKTKGYIYGRLLIVAPENKFVIGFGGSEIEKASLYFGYKF
jgi:hypothetical protein